MSNDLQDFDNDDCEKIIPHGTVLQEQRFVRTSILEANLDDVINDWSDEDGTIIPSSDRNKTKIGLPLWAIDETAASMTRPKTEKLKSGLEFSIGFDKTFLPGFKKTKNSTFISISKTQLDKTCKEISFGEN